MDLTDFRWSVLHRFDDSAKESALSLLAAARMPFQSHDDIAQCLGVRLQIRIIDEMHDFSFNCRKVIEIASVANPGIRTLAEKTKLLGAGRSIDLETQVIQLSDKDFFWIINRIVHSLSTYAASYSEFQAATQTRIFSKHWHRYFGFHSDKDVENQRSKTHYVDIEEFIGVYLCSPLQRAIQDVLDSKKRRY